MNYNEVQKIIKKHTWWSEESPGTIQKLAYILQGFVEQSFYFHPKYLSTTILIFSDNYFYEETPAEEKLAIYYYIYEQCQKDPKYLEKKSQKVQRKITKALRIAKQFVQKKERLTNRELWLSYYLFLRMYLDACRYFTAWEAVDPFTEYELESLLKKELPRLSPQEYQKIMINFNAPSALSFMEKERILRLEIALALKDKKLNTSSIVNKKIKQLTQKYFFTQSNYKNARSFTEKDFLNQIRRQYTKKHQDEINKEITNLKNKVKRLIKKKHELMKKYLISPILLNHFQLIRTFGRLIDERKEKMLENTYYIDQYIDEIAKRFNLSFEEVNNYLAEDIKNLLLKNKKVPSLLLGKRKISAYVFTKKPGSHKAVVNVFYGKETKNILQLIMTTFQSKEIKGQVANAPVKTLVGKVQVILDPHSQKFTPGNILVTSMTRPDFVPIMHQAQAIITDEGGITCHAAIISRELGIPCIIGTRTASKVLKNGDIVKIDTKTGIIRRMDEKN